MSLPPSIDGGPEFEMETYTINYNNANGVPPNWWIYLGNAVIQWPLGYYDARSYTGRFQTSAADFMAGGEVFAPSHLDGTTTNDFSNIQMGSGKCAETGFSHAGYVWAFGYWRYSDWSLQFGVGLNTIYNLDPVYPHRYDTVFSSAFAAPQPYWPSQSWFYFGGDGSSGLTCVF
jgi:hypothetical protein